MDQRKKSNSKHAQQQQQQQHSKNTKEVVTAYLPKKHFSTVKKKSTTNTKTNEVVIVKIIEDESTPQKPIFHSVRSPSPFFTNERTEETSTTNNGHTHNTISNKIIYNNDREKQRKIIWDDYPYTANEVGHIPVSKFNDSLHFLDDFRVHVVRDIRRKFKNKIAARNCRKRKIQHIDQLDSGVDSLESRSSRVQRENEALQADIAFLREKTKRIKDYIFQQLRDDNGKLYSKESFSLVFSRDDNKVFLVLVPL